MDADQAIFTFDVSKFSEVDGAIQEIATNANMLRITDIESKEQFDRIEKERQEKEAMDLAEKKKPDREKMIAYVEAMQSIPKPEVSEETAVRYLVQIQGSL